jgi:hypothetical protein
MAVMTYLTSSIQAAIKDQELRRDELILVMTRTRWESSQYLNQGERVKEMMMIESRYL